MDKNPYQVLGVSENATEDEIRQAYRTLAKKYHPDLNPHDPTAAQKMNEVNEAYDLLKNPQAYRQQQAQQRYQQQARQQYQNQQYYDPFSAFWGGQSQGQDQDQGNPFYTYTYHWSPRQENEDDEDAQNPFQYRWTYHRTHRGINLWSILKLIIVISLLAALFRMMFGFGMSTIAFSRYEQAQQEQQTTEATDDSRGFGGGQQSTGDTDAQDGGWYYSPFFGIWGTAPAYAQSGT